LRFVKRPRWDSPGEVAKALHGVNFRISYIAKKHVPLSRANLCIWSKIRAILGWSKFVSSYVERDKKNLKLAVFGVQVAALLVDFYRHPTEARCNKTFKKRSFLKYRWYENPQLLIFPF
jgi:hypothetical protein